MAITRKAVAIPIGLRKQNNFALSRQPGKPLMKKLPKATHLPKLPSEKTARHKTVKLKTSRKIVPSMPQNELQAVSPAQEVQLRNVVQIPLHEDAMEDLIISANPQINGDLDLAITACSIPWSGELNQIITTQLGSEHEQGKGESSSPIFYRVGSVRDFMGVPNLAHALYGMGRIIISQSIEFSGQKVIFKNVSVYMRAANNFKYSQGSPVEDGWNEIGETVDLELSLDQAAIEQIQAVCAHWDESFCFGNYGQPKTKNDVRPKFLGFKMLGCKSNQFAKNWSERAAKALENISTVLTF